MKVDQEDLLGVCDSSRLLGLRSLSITNAVSQGSPKIQRIHKVGGKKPQPLRWGRKEKSSLISLGVEGGDGDEDRSSTDPSSSIHLQIWEPKLKAAGLPSRFSAQFLVELAKALGCDLYLDQEHGRVVIRKASEQKLEEVIQALDGLEKTFVRDARRPRDTHLLTRVRSDPVHILYIFTSSRLRLGPSRC